MQFRCGYFACGGSCGPHACLMAGLPVMLVREGVAMMPLCDCITGGKLRMYKGMCVF